MDNLAAIRYLEDIIRVIKKGVKYDLERIAGHQAAIDGIKKEIVSEMKEHGVNYSTPSYDVFISKGRTSVKILDADKIPANMKREEITLHPDKKTISKLLADGHTVDGAELVLGDDFLVIKGK